MMLLLCVLLLLRSLFPFVGCRFTFVVCLVTRCTCVNFVVLTFVLLIVVDCCCCCGALPVVSLF